MKTCLLAALSVFLFTGTSMTVSASPVVTWSETDSATYGATVNFESTGVLANDTLINNQFQSEGLLFSGTIRANGCGPNTFNAEGMSGNTLGTYGPGCNVNAQNDAFAMKFSQKMSLLAFDARLSDTSHTDTIDILDNGNLVGSYAFIQTPSIYSIAFNICQVVSGRTFCDLPDFRSGIVKIDGNGTVFDEVRFSEFSAPQTSTYFIFDNVRFNIAANSVPEPISLMLVAVAFLACLAVTRRQCRYAAE